MSEFTPRTTPRPHDNRTVIAEMISRYGSDFKRPLQSLHSPGLVTVLVTGTTGNVGSDLLWLLLSSPEIVAVYAFNRKSKTNTTSKERQRDAFRNKSFDVRLLDSDRLTFLEGDTSAPLLGLASSTYETLRYSVTHIVHNAWPISLSRPLSSFGPIFLGLRNLLDLASDSPNASTIRFIFISSLRVAQSWDLGAGPVPEEVLMDSSVANGVGYGASKFVAERIVAASGLHTTSIRINQICGQRSTGAWPSSQWFPGLVKSSIAMGALPLTSGFASWVHMEPVAQGILDVILSPKDLPSTLNFFHPKPVDFNFLIQSVHSALQETVGLRVRPIRLIPYDGWFHILEQRALHPTQEDYENMPAIRLVNVFRSFLGTNSDEPEAAEREHFGFPLFSTEKAQTFSPTIRNLPKLNSSDVNNWVKYWMEIGYLSREVRHSRL